MYPILAPKMKAACSATLKILDIRPTRMNTAKILCVCVCVCVCVCEEMCVGV